jgi:hypothetical protein
MIGFISPFNHLEEEGIMQFSKLKRTTTLFIGFVTVLVFCAVGLNAQQPTRISGKITAAATHQDSIIVGDVTNHELSLRVSEGTNINTGELVFMDGAQIVNMSYSDLIQGNGVNQGYVKFTKSGDTTFAEWQGKIETKVMPEGNPVVNIEGTYIYIRGAGSFENIKGEGSFKGEFTSKTEYTVEWQGSYIIEE